MFRPPSAAPVSGLKHAECIWTMELGAPGVTLALAAIRPQRTVSTFIVWESQKAMTDLVHGHSDMPAPDRQSLAMVERRRKEFHFEFTTLRFRPLGEHGEWDGRRNIIPTG